MTLIQTTSEEPNELATPDVTTVQLVAVVQAVLGVLVAFGAPVSREQGEAIIQLCTALAVGLPIADAIIRNGRARGSGSRY